MSDTIDVERLDAEAVNSARTRQPLYAPRKKVFPKRASGQFRSFKWLVMAITLGIYYLTPWLRWDRGPFAPDQAVLIDMANRRFYFFFIEIWPQEFYLCGRPAGDGRFRTVPGYVGGWQSLVRLHLSANGLGRSFPGRRARDRRRPQRSHQARQGKLDRQEARPARGQACDLDRHCRADRRRMDLLLRRCADAAAGFCHGKRGPDRLHHRRDPDCHDLHVRRADAGAGLHLHVPMAAHPGGHARRTLADRNLQRLAR